MFHLWAFQSHQVSALYITGDDPRALPTASTCSLTLALPLSLTEYNNFKERMTMAVLNTVRFGQL